MNSSQYETKRGARFLRRLAQGVWKDMRTLLQLLTGCAICCLGFLAFRVEFKTLRNKAIHARVCRITFLSVSLLLCLSSNLNFTSLILRLSFCHCLPVFLCVFLRVPSICFSTYMYLCFILWLKAAILCRFTLNSRTIQIKEELILRTIVLFRPLCQSAVSYETINCYIHFTHRVFFNCVLAARVPSLTRWFIVLFLVPALTCWTCIGACWSPCHSREYTDAFATV